jgi:hypothetical protein
MAKLSNDLDLPNTVLKRDVIFLFLKACSTVYIGGAKKVKDTM